MSEYLTLVKLKELAHSGLQVSDPAVWLDGQTYVRGAEITEVDETYETDGEYYIVWLRIAGMKVLTTIEIRTDQEASIFRLRQLN